MTKHNALSGGLAIFSIVLLLLALGCSSGNPLDNPAQPNAPPANNSNSGDAPTKAPPTRTPIPPTATPTRRAFDPDVRVRLLSNTALLYQPDGNPIAAQEIPGGSEIVLFGKDDKGKWYRVMWEDQIGWVPASVVDFPATKATLLRAPPPCSKGLAVTQGLGTMWTSTYSGDVAIVIDLYRASFGNDYPQSKIQINVNGNLMPGKERTISTRGKRLLSGAVIPAILKKGQTVAPILQTSSREPLKQIVTYYSVPAGCTFPPDN